MFAKRLLINIFLMSLLTINFANICANAENIKLDIPQRSNGKLIAVGGGGLPNSVARRVIELAGGPNSTIFILPDASNREKHGNDAKEQFEAAGARNVRILRIGTRSDESPLGETGLSRVEIREAIYGADLIWFSGGYQTALFDSLAKADLISLVRARYAAGRIIGGSSAGAAIFSKLMITGNAQSLNSLTSGSTHLGEGLGLLPNIIVDQHFLERQRNNRLLAAVIDNPEYLGIGIDERTGIALIGNKMDIIGESSVVIFDAREAEINSTKEGKPISGINIKTHVLSNGDSILFDQHGNSCAIWTP